MLRSLAHGWRDFKAAPDTLCVRYNWIFLGLFAGRLYPKFDPPLPGVPAGAGLNFWVVPPQTRYVVTAETRRCKRAVFHFSHVPGILEQAARHSGCLAMRLTLRQLEEVRSLVGSIEEDYRRPTLLSEVRFEQVLLRLTLLALQPLDGIPVHPLHNVTRDRVERAIQWFTDHMAETPSLHAVASAVHVSSSHLRRHFYERLGRSPKAVFTRARMQRATSLLIGSDLTLEAIAERCGFSTASDFGRAFKAEFHTTPNSWRRTVNSAAAPRRR